MPILLKKPINNTSEYSLSELFFYTFHKWNPEEPSQDADENPIEIPVLRFTVRRKTIYQSGNGKHLVFCLYIMFSISLSCYNMIEKQ